MTLLNARSPSIVALSNNTRTNTIWNSREKWYNSTLAGVVMLASDKWEGYAAFSSTPYNKGPALTMWGTSPAIYLDYTHYPDRSDECAAFIDPRDDVVEDLNRLVFYAGYITGARVGGPLKSEFVSQLDPGLEIDPIVTGHTYGHRNLYQTNLRWFGAAAGVEILCIALVLPTFIGWWRLGRRVSFSPLEIAKVGVTVG